MSRIILFLALILALPGCGLFRYDPMSINEMPVTSCAPTAPDALGPYYTANAPERPIITDGAPGEPLTVSGVVMDSACNPIPNAIVDVWQADGNGEYDLEGYTLRGVVRTDETGRYSFETVLPGYYGSRPRHIHYKVTAPDGTELVTQLYFVDENQPNPSQRWIELDEDNDVLYGEFNITLNG